jgi:integrase
VAGQIVKRGERNFLIRVYLGEKANGKRDYLNQTVKGSKKDAQAILNKLLRDKDMGVLLEPSRMSLDDYLDHWLEVSVKPRVRARTHKEYGDTLRRYVRPRIGIRRLDNLKPVDIQAVYSEMQEAGLGGMVRLTHTLLKGALTQAVKWQMLARNPADYVDLPKRKASSKTRALSKQEVERFIEATRRSKWHTFFHLMVGTGLRPSKALALTWKDVDLAKGTLTVRHSLGWLKGEKRFVFNDPKTASSRRTVPLPYGLVKLLSEHMTAQFEKGFTELVFCTRAGDPAHQRVIVQEAFKPALVRAGLSKETRLYDLRHTHATLLLLAGVHPKVVSERLGHASVSITLDVYSHVLPNMQQEAAEKLDAMLYSADQAEATAHTKN